MFQIKISLSKKRIDNLYEFISQLKLYKVIFILAVIFSVFATLFFFSNDQIVIYGDAESHLNIAKRVIHSITPGAAQLGGIWLPLPHIMLIPFVFFDFLWRTGLAGSIVSGIAFVVSSLYLFKTALFLTKNRLIAFVSFLVFATNPNILYLQATPMTEIVLIMFFILSTYYFIRFLYDQDKIPYLIAAGFFGFCASLSRYDGWFLVLFEALAIIILYITKRKKWRIMEGQFILFSTLAFFGIALWMLWDFLILGDPFYFTNSQFSAKTQQENWYLRGELPAFHNGPVAFLYYFVTAMSNGGILIFLTALAGAYVYIKKHRDRKTILAVIIFMVPFIFNVVTLYLGQSVIFIPHLTPSSFEWTLFNVRYGVMMVPAISLFFAYLFTYKSVFLRATLVGLFLLQMGLYLVGYSQVISLSDGAEGLSSAKRPDAEQWIAKNYDEGLVLVDDYARTVSIVRSGIPMQNIIYIGNREYWEESFYQPEKYATWIIMQKNDALWDGIYEKPHIQSRLFTYFNKVYTSPDILIFRLIKPSS